MHESLCAGEACVCSCQPFAVELEDFLWVCSEPDQAEVGLEDTKESAYWGGMGNSHEGHRRQQIVVMICDTFTQCKMQWLRHTIDK